MMLKDLEHPYARPTSIDGRKKQSTCSSLFHLSSFIRYVLVFVDKICWEDEFSSLGVRTYDRFYSATRAHKNRNSFQTPRSDAASDGKSESVTLQIRALCLSHCHHVIWIDFWHLLHLQCRNTTYPRFSHSSFPSPWELCTLFRIKIDSLFTSAYTMFWLRNYWATGKGPLQYDQQFSCDVLEMEIVE